MAKAKSKTRTKQRAKPRRAQGPQRKAAKVKRGARAVAPTWPQDLERRLKALAVKMEKSVDAVMLQALCEFADAWEDHFRTAEALSDDDRVRVVIRET